MQCEERGYSEAAPDKSGSCLQEQKDEDCVGGMQQKIDGVRAGGTQAEELAIEGVRQPGDGMPVGGFAGAEGPFDGVPRDAGAGVRVFGDMERVVIIEKGRSEDRAVDGNSRGGQEDCENQRLAAWSGSRF
jgi:hypothetical protein